MARHTVTLELEPAAAEPEVLCRGLWQKMLAFLKDYLQQDSSRAALEALSKPSVEAAFVAMPERLELVLSDDAHGRLGTRWAALWLSAQTVEVDDTLASAGTALRTPLPSVDEALRTWGSSCELAQMLLPTHAMQATQCAALRSDEVDTRRWAAYRLAIGRTPEPSVFEALIRSAKLGDGRVTAAMRYAALALAERRPEALNEVGSWLTDSDPHARAVALAVAAGAARGDQTFTERALSAMLEGVDAPVPARVYATEFLGYLGLGETASRALDKLSLLLEDAATDPDTLHNAILSTMNLAVELPEIDEALVERVTAHTSHPHPMVRSIAQLAAASLARRHGPTDNGR